MRRALPKLASLLLCLAACGPDPTGPEPVATTPPAADAAPPVQELVAEIDRRAETIEARLVRLGVDLPAAAAPAAAMSGSGR